MRIVAVETASLSERKDIVEGRAHLANLIARGIAFHLSQYREQLIFVHDDLIRLDSGGAISLWNSSWRRRCTGIGILGITFFFFFFCIAMPPFLALLVVGQEPESISSRLSNGISFAPRSASPSPSADS